MTLIAFVRVQFTEPNDSSTAVCSEINNFGDNYVDYDNYVYETFCTSGSG